MSSGHASLATVLGSPSGASLLYSTSSCQDSALVIHKTLLCMRKEGLAVGTKLECMSVPKFTYLLLTRSPSWVMSSWNKIYTVFDVFSLPMCFLPAELSSHCVY